jgi:type VI secretion system secreted protein VgrG
MLSQSQRAGKLTTPLGQNKLCLVEISGWEGLSELFEFSIVAASEDADVDVDALIGQPAHVELDCGDTGRRFFHGLIIEANWERAEFDLFYYRLVLRPWFWLLGKTTDCRIYHDKTTIDIIRETLSRRGFSDFRLATTQSYPNLHYTVQYRETDLNFLCRLMEQHGIYYFFEHTADRHTLVIADGPSSHTSAPGLEEAIFNPQLDDGVKLRQPTMFSWLQRRGLRSGKVQLTDYNHLKPSARMLADANGGERYKYSDLEVFDYPGPYAEQPDGERYARIRLEAEQALDKRRTAKGVAVAMFPGAKVNLTRYPRASENAAYLGVRVNSRFGVQGYRSQGSGAVGEGHYQADYEFQKLDIPFRAPIVTKRPLIHSLQTAIVTGQKGEEIDCDDHGRILVHFYWDRHDDKSCRLRVSQVWAGQNWGAQVIPRIGMEVMVAFIEGDPDRPIVVGTVPNPQKNRVPYELPANKTRMVWRSATHKGSGFNELSFDDANGAQDYFLHAEKDMRTVVRHNQSTQVDGPLRTIKVSTGDEQKEITKGNLSEQIAKTRSAKAEVILCSADEKIQLNVGENFILIDKGKIVVSVGGKSVITLTPTVIDQIAAQIHLNKDKA